MPHGSIVRKSTLRTSRIPECCALAQGVYVISHPAGADYARRTPKMRNSGLTCRRSGRPWNGKYQSSATMTIDPRLLRQHLISSF